MLLIAHGALCIVDGVDATVRSGAGMNVIALLLHTNMIGWVRFGTLALKEVKAWYAAGSLDIEFVDEYLDAEYSRLLGLEAS